MSRQFYKVIADDGAYIFINADAEAYFDELELQGFTEVQSLSLYSLDFDEIKEAIDIYFIALAGGGIFAGMVAMYMYIGGTAATHAINAANVGVFDLTFFNSPTHSAAGTAFNGTTQYADMSVIPITHLTTNDVSISIYTASVGQENRADIGVVQSATQRLQMQTNRTDNMILIDIYNTTGGRIFGGTSGNGHTLASRRAGNDMEAYRNKISEASIVTGGGSIPSITMFIGAANVNGVPSFSSKTHSFGHAGLGLTTVEVGVLYDALQALQTTLGRNV